MCSAYAMLQCGQCPYFYLMHKDCTILFIAAGVCGSETNTRAIMSRSSENLRKQLIQSRVNFIGTEANGQINKEGTLVFIGKTRVHALIDFLMNATRFNGTSFGSLIRCDVPQIISPVAFVNASMKTVQVFKYKKIC